MRGPERRPFPAAAREALLDPQLRGNMRRATDVIRARREAVVAEMPHWEALREAARAIKEHTLRRLPAYLEQLETSASAAGATVHWAADAAEARRVIGDIVAAHGAREVVKVKSISTDEVGLNGALEARGVDVVETDLAELIIQLAGEPSSHFLVPAIHKSRAEIREVFAGSFAGPGLTDEPAALAEAARRHLRERFLRAQVAISGANFGVAETGSLLVVESEGNGRMCLTLPRVLITLMGIEKVLPTFADLEVFLQLLSRSATGERMSPYTSVWTGVTPGDGPQEVHLVVLDNGRSRALADPVGRPALACIRCSACLNICPVYSRTGGHAYDSVYPGPIGAILTPLLEGVEHRPSLPGASSLCGACLDVCPVKIDIPRILVHLRGQIAPRHDPEALAMRALAWGFSDRRRYERGLRLVRAASRPLARDGAVRRLPGPLAGWTAMRDAPAPAPESFREWWARR